MSGDLERRLGHLEDIVDIHQLFVDYGRALDDGDVARYASLFSATGRVDLGPIGRAEGREAIEAMMAAALRGLVGNSFHLVTSPQVSIDGDRATATVMWTVIRRDEGDEPRVTMIGRHHDRLVREGGRWCIAERRGTIDVPSRYRSPDR